MDVILDSDTDVDYLSDAGYFINAKERLDFLTKAIERAKSWVKHYDGDVNNPTVSYHLHSIAMLERELKLLTAELGPNFDSVLHVKRQNPSETASASPKNSFTALPVGESLDGNTTHMEEEPSVSSAPKPPSSQEEQSVLPSSEKKSNMSPMFDKGTMPHIVTCSVDTAKKNIPVRKCQTSVDDFFQKSPKKPPEPQDLTEKVEEITDSIAETVNSLLNFKNYSTALEFIRMIPLQKPTKAVLKRLVHEIFMKPELPGVTSWSYLYLIHLLQTTPPFNEKEQCFYKDVIFSYYKDKTMWEFVSICVNCCLRKCGTFHDIPYAAPCKNKDCNSCLLTLEYLIEVLKVNLEETLSARRASRKAIEPPSVLLCYLFWRSGKPESSSTALISLLDWIDKLCSVSKSRDSLLKSNLFLYLMTLFNLAMSVILLHSGCTELEMLENINCTPLNDVLQTVYNCKIITTHLSNLELFLAKVDQLWLRIRICDSLLSYMTKEKLCNFGGRITFRKIIKNYMFKNMPNGDKEEETIESNTSQDDICGPCLPKKRRKMYNCGSENEGYTEIHKLCASNRPGTLLEILSKDAKDINSQDIFGQTPLHVAAASDLHLCALVLLRKGFSVEADVFARDECGNTPLHIAVENDAISTAHLLLNHGGSRLVSVKNNSGYVPQSLVKTTKMELLFKLPIPDLPPCKKDQDCGGDSTPQGQKPALDGGTLYRITESTDCLVYLFCLNTLLSDLAKFFEFNKIPHQYGLQQPRFKAIQKHLDNFGTPARFEDVTGFFDDLIVLRNLHKDVENFTKLFDRHLPWICKAARPLLQGLKLFVSIQ